MTASRGRSAHPHHARVAGLLAALEAPEVRPELILGSFAGRPIVLRMRSSDGRPFAPPKRSDPLASRFAFVGEEEADPMTDPRSDLGMHLDLEFQASASAAQRMPAFTLEPRPAAPADALALSFEELFILTAPPGSFFDAEIRERLARLHPVSAQAFGSHFSLSAPASARPRLTVELALELARVALAFDERVSAEAEARRRRAAEEPERERAEKERAENERIERERIERERIEKERNEKERAAREAAERARVERERVERERAARQAAERERAEKERLEKARIEKEQLERETADRARIELERLEKARIERERVGREADERESVRLGRERGEREDLEEERSGGGLHLGWRGPAGGERKPGREGSAGMPREAKSGGSEAAFGWGPGAGAAEPGEWPGAGAERDDEERAQEAPGPGEAAGGVGARNAVVARPAEEPGRPRAALGRAATGALPAWREAFVLALWFGGGLISVVAAGIAIGALRGC